jgi:predicted TIM-barrel fold metal-dependent hydrolase
VLIKRHPISVPLDIVSISLDTIATFAETLLTLMKLIAIEEHFLTSEVRTAWQNSSADDPTKDLHLGVIDDRLDDLGNGRIELMNETGVDVQVLSLTSPALHNLGAESAGLAERSNDLLFEVISKHPDRFQGLATVATAVPETTAKELERCMNELGMKGLMLCGRTVDKNLDHPDYGPLLDCAAQTGAPVFIHPQAPQKAVRDIYYSGFDHMTDLAFATFGLGWHYEAGIQFVRLMLSGAFDKYPRLQIILGHWGEVILFYTERLAAMNRFAGLKRPISDYLRENLSVTASGMYSNTYLERTVELIGTDRILFSADYPYQYRTGRDARNFLEQTPLSEADKAKFAYGNWEKLTSR